MGDKALITLDDLDTSKVLDRAFGEGTPEVVENPPEVKDPSKVDEPKTTEVKDPPKVEEQEPEKPDDTADVFDSIKLSPHARPATAESFTRLKDLSRAELRKAREETEALKKQLEEAKATPATVKPDEKVLTELEELRSFREAIALEADPTFKERFDNRLTAIDDKIFSRLKSAGASDEDIAKIKELGGVEKVDIDKLAVTPGLRRFIEARLAEKEDVLEERKQALSRGAETRKKFLQEQEQAAKQQSTKFVSESTGEFEKLIGELDAFKAIVPPKDATEEQRKTIEEANKYVATKIADARKLVGTDSPKTRAELAAGYALAHVFLTERDGLAKKVDALTKQLEQAEGKAKAALNAGRTVRVNPASSVTPPPKQGLDLRPANEAMDAFFKNR